MIIKIKIVKSEEKLIINTISNITQGFWSNYENGELILKFNNDLDSILIDKINNYKNSDEYKKLVNNEIIEEKFKKYYLSKFSLASDTTLTDDEKLEINKEIVGE